MLQLSNMVLAEYIEQELEKNPMLERDEGDGDEQRDSEKIPESDDKSEDAAGPATANTEAVSEADTTEPESPDSAEIVDEAPDDDYNTA